MFRPNSAQLFESLRAACERLNLVAVPPSDGKAPAHFDGDDDAHGVLRESATGLMVEGLGQRANLMLTRSVVALADDAQDALARLACRFRVG